MTLQSGDLTAIKAGVCSISYGGTVLGFTQDGATVNIASNYEDVVVDEYGETPVDAIKTGEEVTVVVRLSEFSYDNLLAVLPGAAKVTDGSKDKVTGGNISGFLARSTAAELILHPIKNAAGVLTEDFTIYLAYISEPVEFGYLHNDVRSYEVTFRAVVDVNKSDGNLLYAYGDTTASADTTAPTVASVVPVDNDTGIAIGDNVVITMTDDDLDTLTMTAANVLLIKTTDDTQVAAVLSWAVGAKTITINPNSNLTASTLYRVIVTQGLKDYNGNALATAFSSSFTTA